MDSRWNLKIEAGQAAGSPQDTTAEQSPDSFLMDHLQDIMLSSCSVQDFLHGLAQLTSEAFSDPGSPVLCAMTLMRERRPLCVAVSGCSAHSLEELQYRFTDGPCLTAVRELTAVVIGDLEDNSDWGGYAPAARALGIRSLVSVPLDMDTEGRAALTLYSGEAERFDDDAVSLAAAYALRIHKPVRLATRLSSKEEESADLMAAMQSRTTIDLAVGIVMGPHRCSQNEAFAILRAASSRRNMKLRDLAAQMVMTVGQVQPTTHFDA